MRLGECPESIETSFIPPDFQHVPVFWTTPNVSMFDGISVISSSEPGDSFGHGSTSVNYIFMDENDNEIHSCFFDVSVYHPCLLYEPPEEEYSEPLLYMLHGDSGFITCDDGFTPTANVTLICNDGTLDHEIPDCIDIDECAEGTHDCDFENRNEVCFNNDDGGYECRCIPDYKRNGDHGCIPEVFKTECGDGENIFCNSEYDPVNDVTWSTTAANCSAQNKCRPGSNGVVMRECSVSGEWVEPDTTFCTTKTYDDIEKEIKGINTSDEAGEIVNKTAQLISIENAVLQGGDLLKLIVILDSILQQMPFSLKGSTESKMEFSFDFVKIASDVLDKRNEKRWQNIHRNKGVDMGTAAVFETLETFDEGVSYFIRQYNLTIDLTYANIEYQAYLLSAGYNSMETLQVKYRQSSRVARSVDSTSVSDAVLPSLKLTNDAGIDVVIVYVYHNFGDLLPVGDAQQDESRQWVKSITALKRVRKVNSPVVSVMLYTDAGSTKKMASLTLTSKIIHKEVGYDAECVSMTYGNRRGIWETEPCKLISSQSDKSFTSCECKEVGNYAVLMTIGEKPVPFYIAARRVISIICNGLSVLLLLISFILATLSRISTDRYNLLKVSIISFLPLPVVTIVSLVVDDNSPACPTIAITLQVAQVVNIAWIMNLSIEIFLRLSKYIHTSSSAKFAFACCGWILPAIIAAWLTMDIIEPNSDDVSCWNRLDHTVITAVGAINVIMILISGFCLGYTHILYNREKNVYETDEWRKFWEELRSVMQFLLADVTCWIVGTYTIVTDDLITGYIFALASFVFASDVFLSACATNAEMIRAIGIQYEGDEDYKAALIEVKKTEHARFDARRSIRSRVQKQVAEITQLKKAEQKKKKLKSDGIVTMFAMASNQGKNKVVPAEFEEDFSI
ncbi:adhesion G protein-coupled receptor L4-like [Ptychodera flava]|uniref:adhesion G protein-coupled receptor L4-like n=1 Tax=Ptychodera flava TaxID=63121 RepID=UPI00396A2715